MSDDTGGGEQQKTRSCSPAGLSSPRRPLHGRVTWLTAVFGLLVSQSSLQQLQHMAPAESVNAAPRPALRSFSLQ